MAYSKNLEQRNAAADGKRNDIFWRMEKLSIFDLEQYVKELQPRRGFNLPWQFVLEGCILDSCK